MTKILAVTFVIKHIMVFQTQIKHLQIFTSQIIFHLRLTRHKESIIISTESTYLKISTRISSGRSIERSKEYLA